MERIGFYLRRNILPIQGAVAGLLAIYLVKLTNMNIGIDTEFYMGTDTAYNHLEIGRFGRVALTKLWEHFGVNPYFITFLAFVLLVLASLLWACLLREAGGELEGMKLFVFLLAFGSSGVWVLQMYFTLQCVEVFTGVCLCAVAVRLCYLGLDEKKPLPLLGASALLALITGIYQSMLLLFFAGVVAYYFVAKNISREDTRGDLRYVLGSLLVGVMGLVLYFLLNQVVQMLFVADPGGDYLTDQIHGENGILVTLKNLAIYVIGLCFGDFKPVSCRLISPDPLGNGFYTAANPLLIIMVPLFWGLRLAERHKSIVFNAAVVLFPALILVFPILGGGSAPIRSEFVLPLITAFVYFDVLAHLTGKAKTVLVVILLSGLFLAVQKQAFTFYSDQVRYEADRKVAQDISDEIARMKGSVDINGSEILLTGHYDLPIKRNYAYSEGMGASLYWWDSLEVKNESTRRGVMLLRALGYDVKPYPDKGKKLKKLHKAAKKMPAYPAEGWMKKIDGIYVGKLSN